MTALAQRLYRGALAPGSAPPSIRAVGVLTVQTVGASNMIVQSPASIQVGDILVAIVMTVSNVGTYSAPPFGWVLSNIAMTDGSEGIAVYMKQATYSDVVSAGSGTVFSWSGSVTGKGFMLAVSGADLVDAITAVIGGGASQKLTTATYTPVTQAANLTRPVGAGGWLQYQVFFAHDAGLTIASAPAGMTVHEALSNGAPGSFVSYSSANGVSVNPLVWSAASNGWLLDLRFYAAHAMTPLYTVPAATRAAVTDITISNPAPVAGYAALAAGGVVLLPPTLINAGSLLTFSLKQALLAGEVLAGGGNSWLNAHISGAEMT